MPDKALKALSAVANNLGAIRTKIFEAEQAYQMVVKTDMDYLVLGNYMVKK